MNSIQFTTHTHTHPLNVSLHYTFTNYIGASEHTECCISDARCACVVVISNKLSNILLLKQYLFLCRCFDTFFLEFYLKSKYRKKCFLSFIFISKRVLENTGFGLRFKWLDILEVKKT